MIIDEIFEKKVVACLLKQIDFLATASQHLKPNYFSSPVYANIGKMAIDFYNRYESLLTPVAFGEQTKMLLKKGVIKEIEIDVYVKTYMEIIKIDTVDYKFILENLINFIKKAETKNFIKNAVERYLPKDDFAAIEKELDTLANIKVLKEVEPYDYWENIEERTQRREEEKICKMLGIPTGIKKLDEALYKNGWFKKELYIIMGSAKRGKSMSLLWFSNVASLLGYNVAYFTLEVSKEIISDRLDAMNTDIETKLVASKAKDIEAKIKKLKNKTGKIFIYDYPSNSVTTKTIKGDLKRLANRGTRIDMLVVDYADIMRPDYLTGDLWKDEGNIFLGLRDLAKDFNIPCLTASQINRQGSRKVIADGSDSAGSYDKIKHADLVITINSTPEEREEGVARLHLSENRNGESKTLKIRTDFGKGRFFKEFVEEVLS